VDVRLHQKEILIVVPESRIIEDAVELEAGAIWMNVDGWFNIGFNPAHPLETGRP